MARKPEFDREQVVNQAMHVFWARGFQGATVKDMGDATGLQPGSLYAAFGDKNGLFRAALERYVAAVRARVPGGCSGRRALEAWFGAHIESAFRDGHGRGCLLLNSLMETSELDLESAALVRGALDQLLSFFERCVADARRSECKEPGDAAAVAHSLVAALSGISVLARCGVAPAQLRAAAHVALSVV